MGSFTLKVTAGFTGDSYMQTSEYPFTVNLVDYCAAPTLTTPSQTSVVDYYYSEHATFNLTPFTIAPDVCHVTYYCSEPLYNLCDYSDGTTSASFNSTSGIFSFTSTNMQTFSTQAFTITITGTSGATSESISFDFNLIDPCEVMKFNIDPEIIDSLIKYDVYQTSPSILRTIDPALVTPTRVDTICPDIEIGIMNADGTSLSDGPITYDAETYELRIDTQDIADVDIYFLKVVASFTGYSYLRTSEHPFAVIMADHCAGPTLVNTGAVVTRNYYYAGLAIFNIARFVIISSSECVVTYSCEISQGPDQNLCNYSDELTTTIFDPDTGDFSFTTSDI